MSGPTGGGEVILRLNIDTPAPRCSKVRTDQHVVIENTTDLVARVRLGAVTGVVPAHGTYRFARTAGQLLGEGLFYLQCAGIYAAAGSDCIGLQISDG